MTSVDVLMMYFRVGGGEYRILHVSLIRVVFLTNCGVCVGLFISFLVFFFRFKALLSSKPTNDSTCIEIGYVKYPIFQVSPSCDLGHCAGHPPVG